MICFKHWFWHSCIVVESFMLVGNYTLQSVLREKTIHTHIRGWVNNSTESFSDFLSLSVDQER